VTLSNVKLEKLDNDFVALKEKDLSKHLSNPDGETVEDEKEEKDISRDYPLNEALNLLKGINILMK
jgi:carboxyl-terminal processing protease